MSSGRTRATPGEGELSALAAVARREAHGEAPPGADARGRARVLSAFQGQRAAPSRGWLAVAALAVACAVALAVVLPARAPLRFTVDGAATTAGAYVHTPVRDGGDPHTPATGVAAGGAGATVRFSDGSEIAFAAGAGGRIVEVGPHGARVLLETGTASFTIAHLPGARWSVEAGPYAVTVIGTAFDASWSAEAQSLTVRLRAGEVAVVGPLAPRGVHLRAGQELRARVGDEGELRIVETAAARITTTDATTATAAAPEPPSRLRDGGDPAVTMGAPPRSDDGGSAPNPPPRPATGVPSPPAPSSAPPGSALGWPGRVAAGDFRGVVADAEARGVEGVLARFALPDLAALADAARYAGRPDLARRALLAERARFSGSPEARAAAFLLGRIADDGGGAPGTAVRWYDDYLREAPGGAFAAEALGRKLAALSRAGDPAAHAVAAEYLRRHPDGPHAGQAREILGAP